MAEPDTRPWIAFVIVGVIVAGLIGYSLGRSGPPSSSENQDQPTGGEHGLSLLSALQDAKKDATYFFARLAGMGYGKGFSDACASVGVSRSICDSAWQEANKACAELGLEEDLCFDPLPGYFHLSDDLKSRVRTVFDRYVFEVIAADICIEFAGPTERDTEFGTTCDAIFRPGTYDLDA